MTKRRIIILGGGLAGLSAARRLQERKISCQLFEKEDEIGGLCRSKKKNGFTFDYTGHLLHFRDKTTGNFIRSLLAGNIIEHKRKAWVYTNGSYIHYPFQMYLHELPAVIAKECIASFPKVRRQESRKNSAHFCEWLKATFGEGIARHFLIPYNKKFWAYPLEDMTADWTRGFVPVPTSSQVHNGAKDEKTGYNHTFWYPKKGGIAALTKALSSGVRNIRTGCEVKEIDLSKKEIRLCSGGKEKFDYIISTIPLPELAHIIKDLPLKMRNLFDKLRWNSILNVNLGLNAESGFLRNWVYFSEPEFSFYRVGFYHTFSPHLAPLGRVSLYAEFAYPMHHMPNQERLIGLIKRDLKRSGLVVSVDSCVQDINNIRYGYPIYDHNYQRSVKGLTDYLRSKHIFPCGRYGSWRYLSMSDTVLDGQKVASGV